MMLSLFDYLGRPAGPDLGKLVYTYSCFKKAKCKPRKVDTPTYKGKVMIYEKEFLDDFFEAMKVSEKEQVVETSRKGKIF